MISAFRAVALTAVVLTCSMAVSAQDRPPSIAQPPVAPSNLRIQLVISRYQSEKRVSSVPFTLFVTSADINRPEEPPSRVRIGAELPVVVSTTSEPKQGSAAP